MDKDIQICKSSTVVNFRLPKENEEPNWLGWFNNKENNFTCYADSLEQMNMLLSPSTINELTKSNQGKLCQIIYEKNGVPVKNVLR